MRRVIPYILICTYLTAVFQFTIPYASYYANYTYFSTEVCIHKHNPELECNGSCQLKEMVKQQHGHDQPASDNAIHIDRTSSSTLFFFNDSITTHVSIPATGSLFTPSQLLNTQFIVECSTPPPQLG